MAVDGLSVHHALLFPRKNPKPGHRVSVLDQSTGKIHGVAFECFSYPVTTPQDVIAMEAFWFDPKQSFIEVGIGYLRRLEANTVQMGFLEVVSFKNQDSGWVKTGHEKEINPGHPLIDSAMAAWKFGAHREAKN